MSRQHHIQRLAIPKTNKRDPNFLIYVYLYADLKAAIHKYATGKVLDVGCGNKPYKVWFDETSKVTNYIGCDVVQSDQNQVDILCEATNLPLENAAFDTVISTQTLEHVYDHKRMLYEIARVLKPNGICILSCPMYWPHHEIPYDFFRFTKYGLTQLFDEAQFEIVEIKENGGKYALWGLATFHAFPPIWVQNRPIKWLINTWCHHLDKKNKDSANPSNFVVIAKKTQQNQHA